MEIVHDRERERYSKHISRTFTRGTYYLEVNANHPDYILRTRVLPVPPYNEPALAVEAGMHYIMNVGDAWFAQVPLRVTSSSGPTISTTPEPAAPPATPPASRPRPTWRPTAMVTRSARNRTFST